MYYYYYYYYYHHHYYYYYYYYSLIDVIILKHDWGIERNPEYQKKPTCIEKFLKYEQLMKSELKISRVKIWT